MRGASHSVTVLIHQLQSSDRREFQEAAGQLWARYFADLLDLARRQLSPAVRRRADEEDVLQSMYKSFCLRQQRGEFALADRGDLYRLLVRITQNKVRNLAVHHRRDKRDHRREAGDDDRGEGTPSPLELAGAVQATPAEAMVLVEELEQRLAGLDGSLRQVALYRLQGYTNEEIAGPGMMNCAVRTVERKLSIIRRLWGADDAGGAAE